MQTKKSTQYILFFIIFFLIIFNTVVKLTLRTHYSTKLNTNEVLIRLVYY